MIRLLADDATLTLLATLPADQRDAVRHTSSRARLPGAGRLAGHLGGRGAPARLPRAGDAAPPDRRPRVSDFVTELRREVVGAHAAHRQPRRAFAPTPPAPMLARVRRSRRSSARSSSAYRSLPQPEQTAEPRVVKVVQLGGIPIDGVLADGSLWVADIGRPRSCGSTRASRARDRADQHRRWRRGDRGRPGGRVGTRHRAIATPSCSRGSTQRRTVWCSAADAGGGGARGGRGSPVGVRRYEPVGGSTRLDPRSGRTTRRTTVPEHRRPRDRGPQLWTSRRRHGGAVDARSGRVEHVWPGLTRRPSPLTETRPRRSSRTPPARGCSAPSSRAIFRIEGDRITGRSPVPATEPAAPRARRRRAVGRLRDEGRGHYPCRGSTRTAAA